MRRLLAIVLLTTSLLVLNQPANAAFDTKVTVGPDVPGTSGFGRSTSIDGDTAVVGAPGDNEVYVFVRTSNGWELQTKLSPPAGDGGNGFGESVSIRGDVLAVGAPDSTVNGNTHQGAVYVVERTGTAWGTPLKLTAGDGTSYDELGASVAVAAGGHNIIAGAPIPSAAYEFSNADNGTLRPWTEWSKFVPADGDDQSDFGRSVAAGAGGYIIGAPHADVSGKADQGVAYYLKAPAVTGLTDWTVSALVASDGMADDNFGFSVGATGGFDSTAGTIVVGAWGATVTAHPDAGAVYTYLGGSGAPTAKLIASDPQHSAGLGMVVATDGTTIAAGANHVSTGSPSGSEGAVYAFAASGAAARTETAKLTAVADAYGHLGIAVGVSGDTVIATDDTYQVAATNFKGRAVLFTGPLPTPSPTPVPTPTPVGKTIVGTAKKDVLHGTPGDDIIIAKGGNDVVYGNGGNDVIKGGAGNDKLFGGDGNDTLKGGRGTDKCDGGTGTDTASTCEKKASIP